MMETGTNLDRHFPRVEAEQAKLMVTSFVLIPADNAIVEYERPFQLNQTAEFDQVVNNAIFGKSLISATDIAGIASRALRPEADVNTRRDSIDVPGGWGNRRFRFSATIRSVSSEGVFFNVIYGFTDGYDLSYTGELPPDMSFHINGLTCMKEITRSDGSAYVSPRGSYQLADMRVVQSHDEDEVLLRKYKQLLHPSAILQNLSGMVSHHQNEVNSPYRIDLRTRANVGENMMHRSATLPGRYVSNLVNAVTDYRHRNGFDGTTSMGRTPNILAAASRQIADKSVRSIENPLIRTLFASGGLINGTSISFRNLCACIPNLRDFDIKAIRATSPMFKEASATLFDESDSRDWHGRDSETVAASALKSAVTALMVECQLKRIRFISTNHTLTGTPDFTPDDVVYPLIQGLDEVQLVSLFERRFLAEVVPMISENGLRDYWVTIDNELDGNFRVSIAFDGNPADNFHAATYMDSLTTPLITSNATAANNLSDDFGRLINV